MIFIKSVFKKRECIIFNVLLKRLRNAINVV